MGIPAVGPARGVDFLTFFQQTSPRSSVCVCMGAGAGAGVGVGVGMSFGVGVAGGGGVCAHKRWAI